MKKRTVALLVVPLLVAGCSSAAPAATPSTRASRTPKSIATPTPDSACLPVSDEFAQQIIGKHALVKAAAAKSEDTGSYFVAIRFTHSAGTDVGVWQATSLEGGPFGSVNSFARSYTKWPDTGNAGAKAQRIAEECLR